MIRIAIPSAVGTAAAAMLYRFPPETFPFYPICPIHQFTGLLCPGCGATRALSALLHGHLLAALHLNALFVVMLPFALVYFAVAHRRTLAHRANCWPSMPPAITATLFLAAAIFTLVRNLS